VTNLRAKIPGLYINRRVRPFWTSSVFALLPKGIVNRTYLRKCLRLSLKRV
jgi:hypothetical protein